jgi:hypothetical protein
MGSAWRLVDTDMAGISQIIRWRQGRAVVSNRSAQKARSGDASSSSANSQAQAAPPSTKVSLSGTAQPTTYLEKLKRKAKATNATKVNAVNRQTQATNGNVPAASAAGATMQQSLREALSTFAALAEPVAMTASVPADPPRGPTPPSLPPQTADIAISWEPDPTYDLHAQMQEARTREKQDADAETPEAGEAAPSPAAA